ncbi:MAG: RHS repeat-associated core domain-containing protein [Bacteroidales bacterium]|nr:RHS repeat-associated core domain-containing protein [Bacteroidales bacterium]
MALDVRNGNGCYEFHTTRYSCVPTSVRSTASPTSLNEFDANGNLVFDVDRNMQLHYSTRNMPLEIVFDEGLIRNTYRPDGVKTNKMVYDGKGRLTTNETYLGNLVLNFGVPSQILHPEGVVDVSNLSQPVAHYHLKDHLGNVRAVVNPSATNTALISQTNDYYPFGMCYTKNPGSFTNKRKYNGKEEQEMPGRWLDYGARFYDPQLGRWHGVDPLAEKYRRWTPYNYCVNNPMRFVDPDGMGVDDIYNHAGKYMGTVGSGNNIRILNATQTQFNTMNEDYIMSRSRVVNIQSDEQVTSVINHISTETNNGDVERKAYIVLDTENATLSLDIQPITAGDTKHDSENLYEGPVKIGDASYNKPLGGSDYDVIVGQVHAHNTDKSGIMMGGSTTGYVQSSESIRAGTSEPDKASAMKLGVPVHAIDGNNQQINRVDQNGRESSSVSKEGLLRKSLEIYGGRSI